MTPAELTAWLREQAETRCPNPTYDPESRHYDDWHHCFSCNGTGIVADERLSAAADIIESLTAERDEARHRFNVAIREQMKTFAEKPNFMTFVSLKHGVVGDILHALQDGCISLGKACEALAEVAHGAEPTFAKSDLFPLADDVVPAEEITKLRAERDALAGMVERLRQTLQLMCDKISASTEITNEGLWGDWRVAKHYLALSLPAAVAEVAEWRDKAELLDILEVVVDNIQRGTRGTGPDTQPMVLIQLTNGQVIDTETLEEGLRIAAKEAGNASN